MSTELSKEAKRMQQLAGLIKEDRSWADIDKAIADREAQDMEKANSFVNTTRGKNAVKAIQDFISTPYDSADLRDILEILRLNKKQFQYAAKAAGMDFTTDGAGIRIEDDNYQDQDVSIENINGEWYVG